MLIKAKTLRGFRLLSLDEEIGKVKEFYFDDHHWVIRYLVADTGNWLAGKQVLISPYALGEVMPHVKDIFINLTKKQIENSPSLDSDKPVSRQFEEAYYGFYGFPLYWGGTYMWGATPHIVRDPEKWEKFTQSGKTWDPHLRSTHEVTNYHIHATNGEVGHVKDFIIDDETWAIRYLIIDTKNWMPGKKVLIAPQWIEKVSWQERKVFVNLSRETIKQSAKYTEKSPPTRDYEIELYQHYHHKGYWLDSPVLRRLE